MLVKLLKHEFRATGRMFLPMAAVMLAVMILTRLTMLIPSDGFAVDIISGIFSFVAYFLVAASFAVCVIICVKRFKDNLTGDEGYLMFTLPVKAELHVISKLIAAVTWCIFSLAVALLSIMILALKPGMLTDIANELASFYAMFDGIFAIPLPIYIAVIALIALVTEAFYMLLFYSAISIGQLANSHKTLISCLAFFGMHAVMQIVSSVGVTLYASYFGSIFKDGFATTVESQIFAMMITVLLVYIAFDIALAALSSYLLGKKLNLE